MRVRLPWRLFASYAVVILAGAAVAYVTVRLLAPALFDHQMSMLGRGGHGMPGMGAGPGGESQNVRGAFLSALTRALLVGMVASIAVAGLAAAFVTRRLTRPLTAVRDATRLIAAGHYQARVPVPAEPELAALATDVNTLAGVLARTETRRTRLLGEVAHEMRTPLTAIEGYLEGLIDGVFTPEPEVLGAISDELRRLRRLADDLSALSRAEEQQLDLHPVGTDLAGLAERAATRLAPQFSDAGIGLNVQAPGPLPVHADPDRITQVLTNILGNALTATPEGGSVTVTARATTQHAQVSITDTGAGLAPRDLERIFERFYRAPGPPRRSSGSGIGLTIARNITRAHGGDIIASSPGPGHGATFTVTLPLRPGGAPPRPTSTGAAQRGPIPAADEVPSEIAGYGARPDGPAATPRGSGPRSRPA
jgi:signal transduction histidine kinase